MKNEISKKKKSNDLIEKSVTKDDLPKHREKTGSDLALILERYYTGPLPHPAILKQYEEFIPGSAEKIFKIFEKQTRHRHFLEKKNLENSHNQIKTGQYLGFFICLASLISGTICALQGAILPGSLFGTAGVAGLAAVFIYGSKKKEKEVKKPE